jgi:drug/metabolite transporter (DMT)-like permease
MLYASGMLLVLATVTGGWSSLSRDDLGLLAVSGLIGILLGDVALFTAMARIGPRRTAVMFTSNAPLAAVGGVLLYNESFNLTALGGAALTVVGIAMAVNFGSRGGTHAHVFERIEGSLRTGASWGVLGALGQAVGALTVKPVLDGGADTLAVAATRAVIATAAMWLVARPTDRVGQASSAWRDTSQRPRPSGWKCPGGHGARDDAPALGDRPRRHGCGDDPVGHHTGDHAAPALDHDP